MKTRSQPEHSRTKEYLYQRGATGDFCLAIEGKGGTINLGDYIEGIFLGENVTKTHMQWPNRFFDFEITFSAIHNETNTHITQFAPSVGPATWDSVRLAKKKATVVMTPAYFVDHNCSWYVPVIKELAHES